MRAISPLFVRWIWAAYVCTLHMFWVAARKPTVKLRRWHSDAPQHMKHESTTHIRHISWYAICMSIVFGICVVVGKMWSAKQPTLSNSISQRACAHWLCEHACFRHGIRATLTGYNQQTTRIQPMPFTTMRMAICWAYLDQIYAFQRHQWYICFLSDGLNGRVSEFRRSQWSMESDGNTFSADQTAGNVSGWHISIDAE